MAKFTTLSDLISSLTDAGKTPEEIAKHLEDVTAKQTHNLESAASMSPEDFIDVGQVNPDISDENLARHYEGVKKAPEFSAKEALRVADASDLERISNQVKPILSPTEELVENIRKLPKATLTKLSPYISKLSGPATIAGSGMEYINSAKASNELFNSPEELNWQEKVGKGLKTAGGATVAGAGLAALGSGGGLAIPAAFTAAGGGVASLIGEGLDRYGASKHPPKVIPTVEPIKPGDEDEFASLFKEIEDAEIEPEDEGTENLSAVFKKNSTTINPEQSKIQGIIDAARHNGGFNELMLQAMRDKSANSKEANMLRALSQITTGLAGMGGKGKNVAAKNEGDKYFEDLAKQADAPIEDFKMQLAMDKEDPNSVTSKIMQKLANEEAAKANLNVNFSGLSASHIEKIFPQISSSATRAVAAKMHAEESATKKTNNELVKDNERFDKMNKLITAEVASSRSTFGTHAKTLASTGNIRALMEGRDVNDLDSREVYEVAKSLDRVLSQSNATISGTEKLTPHTARMWLGKALEFVSNKRISAGAGSFMNQFYTNLDREEKRAVEQIKISQKALLSSFKDLKQKDPDKWKLIMKTHDLPEDPFSKSEKEDVINEDDQAIKWAKNPNSKGWNKTQADQILKIHGM